MSPLSKKFSLDQIPDLGGKVYIVTGGATGIGYETALALLRHHARVYIASRSSSKFEAVLKNIKNFLPESQTSNLKFLRLDLSSIRECVSASKQFLETEERLDCVVANAALSIMPCVLSTDGYEIQFATNHLGHYAFISHLLPLIQKTSIQHKEARIVIVASHAHAMYKSLSINFGDLAVAKENDMTHIQDIPASLQRYARSKLANIHYARALQNQVSDQGFKNIYINALNPGTIGSATFGSDDSPNLPWWIKTASKTLVSLTSIPAQAGALTSLMLATDPEIVSRDVKGKYFDVGPLGGKFVYGHSFEAEEKISVLARDRNEAEKLMVWSEEAVRKVLGTSWNP
ncbi:putative carbonyl reductase [Leptodontidium sp. MPI-SDFR-AT-0119]|nr:putative carbonyl reductase [Leptodontidium sp. MPI-SDFR-AT-0119]